MHRTELIMGMPITIDLRDEIRPEVLDRAFDWFREVDEIFSTYTPNSAISHLNSGRVTRDSLPAMVREVLERCDQLRGDTGGYFDVNGRALPLELEGAHGQSVAVGIDPSGYVKGWAVDGAAEKLRKAGARNYMINAGGDVRVEGGALPESNWKVGIQHPIETDKIAGFVEVSSGAVATSGEYARGRHIIDPHTGRVPEGLLSVTIVGEELGTADAYATAAFAMGEEGPRWTMSLANYEAMCISTNGLLLMTPGFELRQA